MSSPPSSVSGNERNPPTSAAASAGTISSVSPITDSPAMFTTRTAASTASIEPSAQFTVATRSGEMPWAAVARRFSATAVVASPNGVNR